MGRRNMILTKMIWLHILACPPLCVARGLGQAGARCNLSWTRSWREQDRDGDKLGPAPVTRYTPDTDTELTSGLPQF